MKNNYKKLIGHKGYFAACLTFSVLMMTLIIFSQLAMEIYAYNFIAGNEISESRKRSIIKRNEQIARQTNSITDKTQNKTTDEKTAKTISKPVEASVVSFIKPVKNGVTTSVFGDIEERNSVHRGHDWAVNMGTNVMASSDGVVEEAYYSASYGYNILVNHESGIKTRYAHLSKILVIKGQNVKQGETIGLSGTTGQSTGPHLHFEVIKAGERVNPLKYINK